MTLGGGGGSEDDMGKCCNQMGLTQKGKTCQVNSKIFNIRQNLDLLFPQGHSTLKNFLGSQTIEIFFFFCVKFNMLGDTTLPPPPWGQRLKFVTLRRVCPAVSVLLGSKNAQKRDFAFSTTTFPSVQFL